MPHSLRVRLKNLQRKGELTEKDIDRIFKALSQEPCERFEWGIDGNVYKITKAKDGKEICQQVCKDAISREAVLQAVSEGCFELRGVYGRCEDLINALPSVTQKSGKWDNSCTCSVCGKWRILESEKNGGKYKFCPNCGCRMVEPQEKGRCL